MGITFWLLGMVVPVSAFTALVLTLSFLGTATAGSEMDASLGAVDEQTRHAPAISGFGAGRTGPQSHL